MTAIVTFTANPAIDVSTSVPRLEPFSKLRCAAPQRDPGGGGINVARVVHRLGGDVLAIYPAGGATGQLLGRLMKHEGIRTRAIATAEETREDITVFEECSGHQYRFVFPGPTVSEDEARNCLETVAALTGPAQFLVASGSLAPGLPADFYGRVARTATSTDTKFVVDASGPSLDAVLKQGVFLVKPNRRELCELLVSRGRAAPVGDADWIDAGRGLIAEGAAEFIALTLGQQGALLIGRDRAWRAAPLEVTVNSVVGAGDSFLGALVHALSDGRDIEAALRHAMAAGAAAVLNPGTQLSQPADIARLAGQVQIRAL